MEFFIFLSGYTGGGVFFVILVIFVILSAMEHDAPVPIRDSAAQTRRLVGFTHATPAISDYFVKLRVT